MGNATQAARDGAVKLYLQFPCSNCRSPVRISLKRFAQFRRAGGTCQHCAAPLECPSLDRSVQGLEVVLDAVGFCALQCPVCHGKLQGRIDALGKSRRCPGCGQRLALKFVAEGAAQSAEPISADTAEAGSKRRPLGTSRRATQPASAVSSSPSKASLPDEPVVEVVEPETAAPEPIVYHGQRVDGQGTVPSRPSRGMQPRPARILAYLLLHFGVPLASMLIFVVVANVSEHRVGAVVGGLCCPSAVWLLVGGFPAWWLSRHVASMFVNSFRCPYCHEEYEAVSRWGCSCGFVDHRERHILSFKCPKCRSVLGYINCERCDSTIML